MSEPRAFRAARRRRRLSTTPCCRSRSSALDLRGRVVRLGPAVDDILSRHDYPAPVAKLLGEAIVLGVLLGSALKFDGRFILQTQTDGPVRMLVVDFVAPGPACAPARASTPTRSRRDRGGPTTRGDAARPRPSRHDHRPGRRHEPLPGPRGARRRRSRSRGARIFPPLRADPDAGAPRGRRGIRAGADGLQRRWRAGGILLQFLPKSPERMRQADLDPGDAPEGTDAARRAEDDAWVEGRSLVETVEDHRADRSRRCRASGCSIACSTSAACACSTARDRGAVLVLARQDHRHAARFSRRRPRPHGRERRDLA